MNAVTIIIWFWFLYLSYHERLQASRFPQVSIPVVSIIDSTSTLSCLLKIYSIINSASNPSILIFKFLIVENADQKLQISSWNCAISIIFPTLVYETKEWNMSQNTLQNHLRGDHFEKDVIFARFYLPDIFSDVKKFIYLDNDIIVTMDIVDLFYDSLERHCDFSSFGDSNRHRDDLVQTLVRTTTGKFRKLLHNSAKHSTFHNSNLEKVPHRFYSTIVQRKLKYLVDVFL